MQSFLRLALLGFLALTPFSFLVLSLRFAL